MVPILMVELDKTHAAFRQTPREHAVGGKGTRVAGIGTVGIQHVRWFVRQVDHLWHARLHPKRQFVVGNSGCDLGIGRACKLVLMQLPEPVEHLATVLHRHPGRVMHIEHRIAPGTKSYCLMPRWQKARSPEVRHEGLAALVLRDEHDKRGQILVVGAQPIVEPSTDAGPSWNLGAALHKRDPRTMVD